MANRITKSPLQIQYEKELKNLQNRILTQMKKGYEFDDNIIPPRPKRITQASINRLTKIRATEIISKAKNAPSTSVKPKKTTAKPSAPRKRKPKAKPTVPIAPSDTNDIGFEASRRIEDEKAKERMESDESFDALFSEARIVLEQLKSMINDARQYHPRSADRVEKLLTSELRTHETAALKALANAPEAMITEAQAALNYNPGSDPHETAILALIGLIKGYIPDAREMRETSEELEEQNPFEGID